MSTQFQSELSLDEIVPLQNQQQQSSSSSSSPPFTRAASQSPNPITTSAAVTSAAGPSSSSSATSLPAPTAAASGGGGGGAAIINPTATRRYAIALVSDFFPPGFGGVEIHIYNLAQCLLRRGHKVIVITRAYGDRNGVRYVTNGLKVYYTPFVGVPLPPGTSTLPSFWGGLPLMRDILIRERIDIVHGHQTTSNLCHESLFHGGMLGLRTCFTDHSLFGFSDAPSIHINKILQWSLCNVDECICVSNTSRENTVLRAQIPPERVNVIANATDTSSFSPPEKMKYRNWGAFINSDLTSSSSSSSSSSSTAAAEGKSNSNSSNSNNNQMNTNNSSTKQEVNNNNNNNNAKNTSNKNPLENQSQESGAAGSGGGGGGEITIVAITRLVYRKGADLFVDVIPEVCKRFPKVRWIVGGDGPRLPQLQQMVDRHSLHQKVRLVGALKHSEVRDVLNQGQIFLNCSLTEAFCIAIIEAASCGLLCVSTNVGGVPEVLPADMLLLAEPDPASIIDKVEEAILAVPNVSPWNFHDNVKRFYSWDAVAERTERVYDRLMSRPVLPPARRLQRYYSVGPVYGLLCLLMAALDWLFVLFLEWLRPAAEIEVAPNFPVEDFIKHEKAIHEMID